MKIKYYKYEYDKFIQYRYNELFRKEIDNIDMLISMIEEDENLYKEYKIKNEVEHREFIYMFEQREDDIRWFYENKDKYFKDIILYEATHNIESIDDYKISCYHECISFFKDCQNGNYMNAYEQIYIQDGIFLYTNDLIKSLNYDDFISEEGLVKDAIIFLVELISKIYQSYKSERTNNRDIFKENNEVIVLLKKYRADTLFRKEVQNIDEIIDSLEKAGLSGNEDEVYKSYWKVSQIRDSIRLYEERKEDMEYFHNNRQLSKFIKNKSSNSRSGYNSYKEYLLIYINQYEKAKTFCELWNYINHNSFSIKNPRTVIKYKYGPVKNFMNWILDEINKI